MSNDELISEMYNELVGKIYDREKLHKVRNDRLGGEMYDWALVNELSSPCIKDSDLFYCFLDV